MTRPEADGSYSNADLAEVAPALHVSQCLADLFEAEDAVHDGLQLVQGEGLVHRLEHGPAADEDALQPNVLHEDRDRIDVAITREDADQADRASHANGAEGLR